MANMDTETGSPPDSQSVSVTPLTARQSSAFFEFLKEASLNVNTYIDKILDDLCRKTKTEFCQMFMTEKSKQKLDTFRKSLAMHLAQLLSMDTYGREINSRKSAQKIVEDIYLISVAITEKDRTNSVESLESIFKYTTFPSEIADYARMVPELIKRFDSQSSVIAVLLADLSTVKDRLQQFETAAAAESATAEMLTPSLNKSTRKVGNSKKRKQAHSHSDEISVFDKEEPVNGLMVTKNQQKIQINFNSTSSFRLPEISNGSAGSQGVTPSVSALVQTGMPNNAPSFAAVAANEPSTSANQTRHNPQNPTSNSPLNGANTQRADNSSGTDDGYRVAGPRRSQKQQTNRRPQQSKNANKVIGSGLTSSNCSGTGLVAAIVRHHFLISRLDAQTTEDTLEAHLAVKQIPFLKIEKVNSNNFSKSFHITVSDDQDHKIKSSCNWPKNVLIGRYFFNNFRRNTKKGIKSDADKPVFPKPNSAKQADNNGKTSATSAGHTSNSQEETDMQTQNVADLGIDIVL